MSDLPNFNRIDNEGSGPSEKVTSALADAVAAFDRTMDVNLKAARDKRDDIQARVQSGIAAGEALLAIVSEAVNRFSAGAAEVKPGASSGHVRRTVIASLPQLLDPAQRTGAMQALVTGLLG